MSNSGKDCVFGMNGSTASYAPLRYDPSLRVQKQELSRMAQRRIGAGVAPEKVGLLNIGTPVPVPLVPTFDSQGKLSGGR